MTGMNETKNVMTKMRKKKVFAIPRHYEELGAYLQKMRLKADLTQRAVAMELEYSSAQFISNIERGIVVPPLRKLKMLIDLYGIPTDTIMALILELERKRLVKALKTGS
mgnify:CR=1 FL=1